MKLWKQTTIFIGIILSIILVGVVSHAINDATDTRDILKVVVEIEREKYESALQAERDKVESFTSREGYIRAQAGKLIFPFYANSEVLITSHFHKRSNPFELNTGPYQPEGKTHLGVDIVSRKNTAIRAPFNGYVIEHFPAPNGYYRGDGIRGGKIAIVDELGFEFIYSHLSDTYVSSVVGKNYYEAGEVIGRMGDTGLTTGPHLHLEVRKMNEDETYTYYDPLDFFDVRIDNHGYVLFPEEEVISVLYIN